MSPIILIPVGYPDIMLKRNMANPSGGILKSFSDIILKGHPNILCSPDEAITEERHINMNIEGIMILKHLLTDSVMLVLIISGNLRQKYVNIRTDEEKKKIFILLIMINSC